MASVNINFDGSAITEAFARLQRGDNSELFAKIAGILADSTEQAFDDETDPTTGDAWEDLSSTYADWRAKHGHAGKILQLTGGSGLAGSIVTEYSNDHAAVGSNKVYAAVHQLGGTDRQNIPARPYLGIDDVAQSEILSAIEAHHASQIGG